MTDDTTSPPDRYLPRADAAARLAAGSTDAATPLRSLLAMHDHIDRLTTQIAAWHDVVDRAEDVICGDAATTEAYDAARTRLAATLNAAPTRPSVTYTLLWSHKDEHHDHLRAVGIDPHDWTADTPLVKFVDDVPVEVVGWNTAGAPEDASLSRDFSWVIDLLNAQAAQIPAPPTTPAPTAA